jgi:hypothetical protein
MARSTTPKTGAGQGTKRPRVVVAAKMRSPHSRLISFEAVEDVFSIKP